MKLIQPAKFFAVATVDSGENVVCGNLGKYGSSQAAHIEADDLVLMSKLPQSASEAASINATVEQFIRRHNEREHVYSD